MQKKNIREAGRCKFPIDLIKVSHLGENITVSDLVPSHQPNTRIITVFNGLCRNICNFEHQEITYAHSNIILKQVEKGISTIIEALHQPNKKINVEPVYK